MQESSVVGDLHDLVLDEEVLDEELLVQQLQNNLSENVRTSVSELFTTTMHLCHREFLRHLD